VTIRCSSTGGDPTPTVKWLRDDTVFDATSTTSGGVTVNEYTFTASPAEHLEVFECQVENGVLKTTNQNECKSNTPQVKLIFPLHTTRF
jgi:hypothetical protein